MASEVLSWFHLLREPPPSSWIPTIAFVFRCLSYALIAPIVFLVALDIVAYVIARTIGAPSHPPPPVVLVTSESDDANNSAGAPPSTIPDFPSTYNASPSSGEANELSGVGLFSPPATRPSSPTADRKLRSRGNSALIAGKGA
ncbi:hypothetical protein BOTBODRAFT_169048 [Botryobasidium botryosum FD-172 SS1]|uniref:Transmembrane protein n=1 Tax=Botryobasidium botryosum (strain FD-172 SS1) TaxID=930990 RepID=A0A067N4J2_BOTB1|nr:hypothetical protein BOTBODRAFT_169048 [Botryobasidium botryosum FD-172 SS1]